MTSELSALQKEEGAWQWVCQFLENAGFQSEDTIRAMKIWVLLLWGKDIPEIADRLGIFKSRVEGYMNYLKAYKLITHNNHPIVTNSFEQAPSTELLLNGLTFEGRVTRVADSLFG